MRVSLSRFVPALLVFAIPLLVYCLTLTPAVSFIDSGELAVVCYTLGISHPTGYPLYTLLGKIVSGLPFGAVIAELNFLSALFASGAALFFYLALRELLTKVTSAGADNLLANLGGAGIALYLAFIPAFWSLAVTNEVYTLHIFFVSLMVFLWLKWDQMRSDRVFFLVCFFYGLSFTNHMTSILLFPSLLIFLWTGWGKTHFIKKRILLGAALFFLGFSLYLYLPIRSFLHPLFDWGHPANWHNFKNHLSGWQYQVWMFQAGSAELAKNLEGFRNLLLKQFPTPILVLGLIGAIYLLGKYTRLAIALILLALLTVIYSINFTIGEIENYFLPAYFSISFFLAVGLWAALEFILSKLAKLQRKGVAVCFGIVACTIALVGVVRNYHQQDKSKNYIAYDLAGNILKSAEAPGLIITDIWDFYAPYLYLHFVEGKEPDKIMIDKELSRRSWYYQFLKQAYPEIYEGSKNEIKEFLEAVYPFEHGLAFDPDHIEQRYQNVLNSLVEQNLPLRKVYFVLAKPEPFRQNYVEIPEGLVFRVAKSLEYSPYSGPDLEIRGWANPSVYKDGRTKYHLSRYPMMLEARAKYEAYFGYDSLAAALNIKARLFRSKLSN
jgi:hypothetical protein